MSMIQEINLTDTKETTFEEKVYVIADEILDILRQFSQENKKHLNTELIAGKMFKKDTLKKLLAKPIQKKIENKPDLASLKAVADAVLDKLSEIVPSFMTDEFGNLRDQFHDKPALEDSTVWLDSSIKIVKKYIDSISNKNKELEEFMRQSMHYLADTEKHLSNELSSHQQKYNEDREFEKNISNNMDMMTQDFKVTDDISGIRMALMGKIENINKGIEKKREQDMLRLRETEKTIEEMGTRITNIKKEADEIKKKAQELEIESSRDRLTGLHNRKAYDEKITETLANLKRYNVPSSLMVCDIDHFKKINDNFGHKVGDLALKKLADLLTQRLRVNDFVARYGGEEFVIILPHTPLNNAKQAGESVRSYIDNSVFTYKDKKIPLTISIGISSFKKEDDSTTVFERADKALYLAKNSGRNTVRTEDDVIG